MNDEKIVDATRRRPPVGDTKSTLAAAASSAALAFGGTGQYTIVVGVACSIAFGASAVGAPTDTAEFPSGMYDIFVDGIAVTHLRWTANAAGTLRYWKSGRLAQE